MKEKKDPLSNLSRFGKENPCGECFNCCKGVLVKVRDEDLERWQKEQRYDILLCITKWPTGSTFLISKKDKKNECIFLTPNGCRIHPTRPLTCRRFPLSKDHAAEFDCKLKDFVKNEKTAKNKTNHYDPTRKC